jgi:DNA invertase Pin-like site-specific DNA recombinase
MKKVAIYSRFSVDAGLDADSQREEILARLGGDYEIVGEYRDVASGTQEIQDRPGLKKLLEAVAGGEVEVLLCSDLTRLTRSLSLEIIEALQKAGVQIVTTDGTEISFADLVAHMTINPIRRTFVEAQSQRIKRGIRAARERRNQQADGSIGK